jgi:hypothetical protein
MKDLMSNNSAVTGRVNGVYDKETKKGIVKRGLSKAGNKYQVFVISVSKKNEDGTYTNGMGIPVMLTGDTKVEAGDTVGLVGRFVPNNYTNKDGKEVRGLQLMAKCEDMFKPLEWTKEVKAEVKEDEGFEW